MRTGTRHTDLIATLKSRLDIVAEFRADARADSPLVPSGRDFKVRCPFHIEKSPSCVVHPDTQDFKCFGCGKGGDVLDYIAWQEGLDDFTDVLKNGCLRAGIDYSERSNASSQVSYSGTQNIQRSVRSVVGEHEHAPTSQPPAKPKTVYSDLEKLRESAKFQAHPGKIVEINKYNHPDTGLPDVIAYRIEVGEGEERQKRFLQATPCEGGYCFGGIPKDKRTPLFNRIGIRENASIVLVEGEKKVRALYALGICGTCNLGGSNAAGRADWTPLSGKHVTIWPDHDDPGKKWLEEVLKQLRALPDPPEISIVNVEPLGLCKGGDVVDYIEREKDHAVIGTDPGMAVCEVIANADSTGIYAEMLRDLNDAMSGARKNIAFQFPKLSSAMRALIPGAVTVLCGGPGSAKSLLLVQILRFFMQENVKAVALCCEDGGAFHLRRAFAQEAQCTDLTSDEWCRQNPDGVASRRQMCADAMKRFAKFIEAPAAENDLTCDDLLVWLEQKCEQGHRVMAIDPITVMAKGKFGFEDDLRFMMKAKRLMEKYKASLILVTHPRKAPAMRQKNNVADLSDLAGGAAYERFAQSIWYLKQHEIKECELAHTTMIPGAKYEHDRTIIIFKARNSWGLAKRFAFKFNKESLTMAEVGMIA